MKIVDESTELGVVERRFDLNVDGDVVPGIHWLPEGASVPHPTVLIGHGGTQHKRVPNVLGLARKLVRAHGYGVVALDSMGTAFGLPLLAGEKRVSAAVLGLGALREGDERQRAQAASITIPILFLFQSDDELMTREGGLALWDAFGPTEKTLHLNPGPHVGIPLFERDAVVAFYHRHLEA